MASEAVSTVGAPVIRMTCAFGDAPRIVFSNSTPEVSGRKMSETTTSYSPRDSSSSAPCVFSTTATSYPASSRNLRTLTLTLLSSSTTSMRACGVSRTCPSITRLYSSSLLVRRPRVNQRENASIPQVRFQRSVIKSSVMSSETACWHPAHMELRTTRADLASQQLLRGAPTETSTWSHVCPGTPGGEPLNGPGAGKHVVSQGIPS